MGGGGWGWNMGIHILLNAQNKRAEPNLCEMSILYYSTITVLPVG